MTTATEPGRPASGSENPPEPGCPDGRLLALRCLGVPQVITRAPMSRRRALARRLTAFCARIRPRNTAQLASLVLRMGEEIDRRERMLDAALRATAELPGESASRGPGCSRSGEPRLVRLKLKWWQRAGLDHGHPEFHQKSPEPGSIRRSGIEGR